MQPVIRRFLLWYGLGGALLFVGVPVLVWFLPPAIADPVEAGWYLSIPILALVAVIVVRRAGRSGKRAVPRVATLLSVVVIALWGLTLVAVPGFHDATRAKVFEGATVTAPHRTALAIACEEKTLREGMGADELGLGNDPKAYAGDYVTGVEIKVTGDQTAAVVVTYRALQGFTGLGFITPKRTLVRAGDTVVYSGRCTANGIAWTVGGTVPDRYLPRL